MNTHPDIKKLFLQSSYTGQLENIKILWNRMTQEDPTYSQDALLHASSQGRREIVEYLLEQGVKITPWSLVEAAENGHEAVLKSLMLTMQQRVQRGEQRLQDAHSPLTEGKSLVSAAKAGSLNMVKWLLTDEAINHEPLKQDIVDHMDKALVVACSAGHMEVVRYLLIDQELLGKVGKLADIHAAKGKAIIEACAANQKEVVHYLLTSSELAGHTHANIHIQADSAFKAAVRSKAMDVLQYLICDYGLEKTPSIQSYMDKRALAQVDIWFNNRALQGHLAQNLPRASAKQGVKKV